SNKESVAFGSLRTVPRAQLASHLRRSGLPVLAVVQEVHRPLPGLCIGDRLGHAASANTRCAGSRTAMVCARPGREAGATAVAPCKTPPASDLRHRHLSR